MKHNHTLPQVLYLCSLMITHNLANVVGQKKKIAIVGGGVSGLTTAYRLSDEYEVHIYEATDRIGGRMKSVWNDGKRYESGAMAVGVDHEDVFDLASDLGADIILRPPCDDKDCLFYYINSKLMNTTKD